MLMNAAKFLSGVLSCTDYWWPLATLNSRERHLAGAAKEQAGDGLLDALGAKDLWRNALLDQIDDVGARRILPELRLLLSPAAG